MRVSVEQRLEVADNLELMRQDMIEDGCEWGPLDTRAMTGLRELLYVRPIDRVLSEVIDTERKWAAYQVGEKSWGRLVRFAREYDRRFGG